MNAFTSQTGIGTDNFDAIPKIHSSQEIASVETIDVPLKIAVEVETAVQLSQFRTMTKLAFENATVAASDPKKIKVAFHDFKNINIGSLATEIILVSQSGIFDPHVVGEPHHTTSVIGILIALNKEYDRCNLGPFISVAKGTKYDPKKKYTWNLKIFKGLYIQVLCKLITIASLRVTDINERIEFEAMMVDHICHALEAKCSGAYSFKR